MPTLDEIAALAEVKGTLADRGVRLLAFIIDAVIATVLQVLYTQLPRPVAFIPALLALPLGVLQIVMLSTRGQTIGKWLLNVAIVDRTDNQPPGFVRAALIRGLPQLVMSVFFPLFALVYVAIDALPIFGAGRRCIHDMLAGTIVIKRGPDLAA